MRKFSTLTFSLLLGAGAILAQAPQVYLVGGFNNFGEGDLTNWELSAEGTSDDFVATGTKEIPAGEFNVGFLVGDEYYGPNRRSGNELVNFNEGEYNVGLKAMESGSQTFLCEDWGGGPVEIVVEFGSWNNVTFTDPNYIPAGPKYAYLVGELTDYEDDNEDFSLVCEDNDGIYTGYVYIPAGQFSFNIWAPEENELYIPVDGETTEINFEDGVYETDTDSYSGTSQKEIYWEYPEWEGGMVKITLEADGPYLTIEEGGMPLPYISGEFNDFEPNGDSEWALLPVLNDDGTYFFRNTFSIPAGDLEFNFVYNNYYIVPADLEDVEIDDFDGFGSYDLDTDTSDYRWIITDWAGSEEAEFTVNLEEGVLIISATDYDGNVVDYIYVSGAFNEYNPVGNMLYALAPSTNPEENGIYTGNIEIPEEKFSFNLIQTNGSVIIPGTLETVEIEFTEDVYEGSIDVAYDEEEESYYWVCSDWMGGIAIITLDLNESTITIVDDTGSVVKKLNIENNKEDIYNLQGVKMNRENLKSGIYIINGKKVLINK